MRGKLILALAMATLAPAQLLAASAQPSSPGVSPATPAAVDLARLMSPRDLLIATELREFDKNFIPSLRTNPDLQLMEKQYPGVLQVMHRVSRPLVQRGTGQALDRVHVQLAKALTEGFTPSEIGQLTAFYRSSAGHNLLTKMAEGVDTTETYLNAMDDPDRELMEEDLDRQLKASAAKAAETYSVSDQMELTKFMASPVAIKLRAFQPQARAILLSTFSAPNPDLEKQIDAAYTSAIEAHIARLKTGEPAQTKK